MLTMYSDLSDVYMMIAGISAQCFAYASVFLYDVFIWRSLSLRQYNALALDICFPNF